MRPPGIVARAVLVDIEGTTSTIAFVHDVLFPYADLHLDAYVAAHRGDPEVAKAMYDAAMLAGEDIDTDDATILWHLHHWLRQDVKATPLKTLQGLIWAEGYARNGLRGHVYPDAASGLRRWHVAGLRLYVYSSGSIEAQKVLFGNSMQGDLSALFSGNFDTTTGPKRDAASYTTIAASIAPRLDRARGCAAILPVPHFVVVIVCAASAAGAGSQFEPAVLPFVSA